MTGATPQVEAESPTQEPAGVAQDAPATTPAAEPTAQTSAEANAQPGDGLGNYEFVMPEGMTLDADAAQGFRDIAKDLKLPPEQAQKIADIGISLVQKARAESAATFERSKADWADSAANDAEFGGDKFDVSVASAKKIVDQFGTPALKSMLNESGLGNHPEVIRLLYRIGKAISEDTVHAGGTQSPSPAIEDLLYNTK